MSGAGGFTGWMPISDRFSASMARLRLDPGHDRADIESVVHGCVRHAGLREAYVSMTCTRGRIAAGSRDLRTARNTFYCFRSTVRMDQLAGPAGHWRELVDQPGDPHSARKASIHMVKNYHWLDLDVALLEAYDHDAELVVLRDSVRCDHRGTRLQRVRLTPAAGG